MPSHVLGLCRRMSLRWRARVRWVMRHSDVHVWRVGRPVVTASVPTMRRTIAAPLALCAAAIMAACFSERADGTGPDPAASCQIPLDSSVLGSGRALLAIRDFTFVPNIVRVPVGTRVTWVNCEAPTIDPHTTTADGGAWDSALLPSGTVFSRVFDQAGEFPYHCATHPSMRATLVVE